jgi:hypothetical protein
MFMNPTILREMLAEREADLRRRSAQAERLKRPRPKGSRRGASVAPEQRARFRIRPAPTP